MCADRTQGMNFFKKLAFYMRRVCWKRKDKGTNKVTMSQARRVLEESRVVLQVSAGVLPEVAMSSLEDQLLSGEQPGSPDPGTEETVRFLHVGRINLRSYHFAATELARAETLPGVHKENVLYVRSTGKNEDVKTDMQVFSGFVFLGGLRSVGCCVYGVRCH